MVTVCVGKGARKRKYSLPKDLLCYQSQFFDKALNGNFKEGAEQVVNLPEERPYTFDLVIQWIYTGKVILPGSSFRDLSCKDISSQKISDQQASSVIDEYLEFLEIADRLLLNSIGHEKAVCVQLELIIKQNRHSLRACHIENALRLRFRHPLRNLFAEIYCRDYLKIHHGFDKSAVAVGNVSNFDDNLLKIEGFAADMFFAMRKSLETRPRARRITFKDLLTQADFSL
jgi:hypothetical protein